MLKWLTLALMVLPTVVYACAPNASCPMSDAVRQYYTCLQKSQECLKEAAQLAAQVKADGGSSVSYAKICETEADCMNKLKSTSAQPAAISTTNEHANDCPPDQPNCHQQNTPTAPSKPAQPQVSQKPKTTTRVPSSSGSTKSQSTADAHAEASSDIASCSSLEGTTAICCGNPMSCSNQLSPQDQQSLAAIQGSTNTGSANGMNGYCNQMQQLGDSSGHLNNAFAAVCANNQVQCQSTCQQLAQKYQARLSTCNGCAAESVYQSAYDTLNSDLEKCQQLEAKANQLATQGVSSGYNSGMGGACNQMSSAQPESAGNQVPQQALAAANANDPYGCQSNPNQPACQSCAQNPTMPGCDQAKPITGQAGFAQSSPQVRPSDFNVGGLNEGVQPQTQIPVIEAKAVQRVPRIRNNSGGGIPGGDGGSVGGPRANSERSGSGVSMGSGFSTDILRGYRSGGYSQPVGNGGSWQPQNFNTQFANQGRQEQLRGKNGLLGLDLKKYLPGGRWSPFRGRRGLAGYSLSPSDRQINGPSVDMWNRISQLMFEKCRLGVLFDCWSGHTQADVSQVTAVHVNGIDRHLNRGIASVGN